MTPAKKAELIAKHAAARRRLRAEGREESLGNVLGIAGGSKRDIVALWAESDPDVAPLPMSEAEEAFRRTFADYLAAATRFNAISGIAVQYAYPPTRGRTAPPLTRRYALSPDHPWYADMEAEVARTYEAHLKAWDALEGRQEAERREPEPEPEPEPAPALDLANLRAYYLNRYTSPWPNGVALPLEVYPILNTLWKEWDDESVNAQRAVMDARNASGRVPSGQADASAEREATARLSTARMICHNIESDREILRERARCAGTPVPA